MWNSITGVVNRKDEEFLYLQAGPLEWAVRMSASSLFKVPSRGGETRVYLHLHHRQDDMQLFGFADTEEREVFLQLIKVSGIGPKQALRILSGITPPVLAEILDNGDVDALKRVPGLGKATAGKIILALRGKVTWTEEKEDGPAGNHGEIVDSLVNMGFDKKGARTAVEQAAKENPGAGEEILFRDALLRLSQ
jgi:Holliday junction DNA helicase RuvA